MKATSTCQTSARRKKQGYLSILTGVDGELLVQSLMTSWGWLARKQPQELDQGIDIVVELAIDGRGSGKHFGIQCKATAQRLIHVKKQGITVRLEAATVRYMRSQQFPVFVIVADVNAQRFYWLDAKRALTQAPARNDGTVLLYVPASNVLTRGCDAPPMQRDAFLRAVNGAGLDWHAETRASIRSREEELRALDHRLDITITESASASRYTIRARGDDGLKLRMHITPSTPLDVERLREVVDHAVPHEIAISDLHLSGSGALERLFPPGSAGTLRFEPLPGPDVLMSIAERRGGRALMLRGAAYVGRKQMRCRFASRDDPLCIDAVLYRTGAKFDMGMDVNDWRGKKLLVLPGMSTAADILGTIAAHRQIAVRLTGTCGESHDTVRFDDDLASVFEALSLRLRAFDDLRELAVRYCPDLSIGEWNPSEVHLWRVARKILEGETVTDVVRAFSMQVDAVESQRALAVAALGCFLYESEAFPITAFGRVVCTIPLSIRANDYASSWTTDESGRRFLHFARTSTSTTTMSRFAA